jgi:hypothetical protein
MFQFRLNNLQGTSGISKNQGNWSIFNCVDSLCIAINMIDSTQVQLIF